MQQAYSVFCSKIKGPEEQSKALSCIVNTLANTSLLQKAKEILEQLHVDDQENKLIKQLRVKKKNNTFIEQIALEEIDQEQFQEAENTLSLAPELSTRCFLQCKRSLAKMEKGLYAEARVHLNKAKEIAGQKTFFGKTSTWKAILDIELKKGSFQEVKKTFHKIDHELCPIGNFLFYCYAARDPVHDQFY